MVFILGTNSFRNRSFSPVFAFHHRKPSRIFIWATSWFYQAIGSRFPTSKPSTKSYYFSGTIVLFGRKHQSDMWLNRTA